ncbi:MAG: hypothetical protein IPL53_04235 [Ignavibacteria bacterium]|nr:hypothetical protein [Ignavibacteria bacterium]
MKNFFLSFVLLFLSFSLSQAQVNTYTFTQTSGAYSEITGTLFDSATSNSGATSLDDVQYLSRAIGFSFVMNGTAYTTYSMNTNGQITFGATGPGTTNYTPISATTAYESCIAGLSRDLQGIYGFTATRTLASTTLTGVTNFAGIVVGKIVQGTGIPAGTRVTAINTGAGTVDISLAATAAGTTTLNCCSGELRSETQGSAGSRVHIIQWKNFQRFSSATLTDNFNFQIRIYETTNLIEVVYGSVTANATAIVPQVGLRGLTNADFNNRTSTTTWSASTAGAVNTASMTLSSTVFPGSGQIYRWAPFVPLNNDVGTTVILNPVNGGGSGIQAPVATIKNFGNNSQSGYNVTCTISPGGYSNTQTAPLLTTGNTANINFANVNLAANTNYTVTVYTSLPGDQNLANDTQRVSVSLINANYGNDSGYFYANNLALDQPSFPVWCWKDTTGSKSVLVNGVTAPGNTLVGSVDDGYYKLSLKNILLSFGMDTTDKHLKYNGVCYDSIFPGTNGIVGLTEAFGSISLTSFNIDGARVAKNALLPMWHDFDLGTLTFQTTNRLSYLAQGNQLIITYSKVAAFAPENNWATFQVVIEIVSGCAVANSNFRYTMADTTNGQTSAAYLSDYLAQYPAATGGITTFRNYVSGYSQNGAPIAYAGYVSTANPLPASPSTQLNIKRPLYNLTTGSGLAIEYGPNNLNLNEISCSKKSPIRVSVALQGLQSNGSPVGSTLRVRDTVTINVRETFVPYAVLQQFKVYLDSAHNGSYAYGYADLDFAWEQGHPYYLEVSHRNSVFAWSNPFSSNTDSLRYNFTTSIGQTYGNIAVVINGAASMYTGDIASPIDAPDGCVTLVDLLNIYNESQAFASGPYVLADLNYDGTVDLSDLILVYNNNVAFICGVKPPGALDGSYVSPVLNYVPDSRIMIIPDPNYVDKEALLLNEASVNEEKK